jgi:hypothetical protein
VLIADGVYGLTVVADTTSPVYWTGCLVAGALLVLAAALGLRTSTTVALVLATTTAAVGVLSLGYAVLNSAG